MNVVPTYLVVMVRNVFSPEFELHASLYDAGEDRFRFDFLYGEKRDAAQVVVPYQMAMDEDRVDEVVNLLKRVKRSILKEEK